MSIRGRVTNFRIFARCLRQAWSDLPPRRRARLVASTLIRAALYSAWVGFALAVIVFCGWLWLSL